MFINIYMPSWLVWVLLGVAIFYLPQILDWVGKRIPHGN